jgi:hypothetical protein
LPVWIKDLSLSNHKRFEPSIEVFKSPHQALADVAHQYRGMASIYLWLSLAEPNDSSLVVQAEEQIKLAKILWASAIKLAQETNERVIKYYVWMANLDSMHQIAKNVAEKNRPPSKETFDKLFNEVVLKMSDEYQVIYPDGQNRAYKELDNFYEYTVLKE